MTARFFVDENILGVALALAAARDDVVHPGHGALPEVPCGTKDSVWIPVVAERDLVVITRDKKIRRRPGERKLFAEHGLRVFACTGNKDLSTWALLTLLVRRWEKIEKEVRNNGTGPWWCSVTDGRVQRVE